MIGGVVGLGLERTSRRAKVGGLKRFICHLCRREVYILYRYAGARFWSLVTGGMIERRASKCYPYCLSNLSDDFILDVISEAVV